MTMDVRARVRSVPVWCWGAAAVVAGLAVLVWHDWYTRSDESDSWLDDDQPALQLDSPSATIPSVRPKNRTYPPSMAKWPGCAVGDC